MIRLIGKVDDIDEWMLGRAIKLITLGEEEEEGVEGGVNFIDTKTREKRPETFHYKKTKTGYTIWLVNTDEEIT